MCFVKNGQVKSGACLPRGRSELVAALVGGEYDLRPLRMSAEQRGYFFRLGMGRRSELVDFADKFIALKVAYGLVAANTNPIWNLVAGKKLARPVG